MGRLLRASGFELVAWYGHGFAEFDGIANWLSYDRQVELDRFFARLADLGPIRRRASDLVVTARKSG